MKKQKFENEQIKDFYNDIVSGRFASDYEFERWFTNTRLRLDFYMMSLIVKFHLQDVSFSSCLEVGPGPGTWTRLLFRKNSDARFTLVDTSQEMKKQFFLEMRTHPNIDYVVSDYLRYECISESDFFFSSRAFEYIDEQENFIKKMHSNMNANSTGIIITKNPKHRTGLFRKAEKRIQHSGQISASTLTTMLELNGFVNILVYPAIIRLPYVEKLTSKFTEKIFKSVYKTCYKSPPWFAESYVVKFTKSPSPST